MSAEKRLKELALRLPPPPAPSGLYRPVVLVGIMAVTSGHAPVNPDGTRHTGRAGEDLSMEEARSAARQCGLNILASLRQALGSLDRVSRVVRVFGMVNSTPDFSAHPAVLDGCSELFAEVFGSESGVGVRCASGVASLPGNAAVQIEATFEVRTAD